MVPKKTQVHNVVRANGWVGVYTQRLGSGRTPRMLTECARVKTCKTPKPQNPETKNPKPLKHGRAHPARDASRGRGGRGSGSLRGVARGVVGAAQ